MQNNTEKLIQIKKQVESIRWNNKLKEYISSKAEEISYLLIFTDYENIIQSWKYTKLQILDILNKCIDQEYIRSQIFRRRESLFNWDIKRVEWLPENIKKKKKDNQLYNILQIAISSPEYAFSDNWKLIPDKKYAEHNRLVYNNLIDDTIVFPSKLPESFLSKFDITSIDPNCQVIKDIFKKSSPLKYNDWDHGKSTYRVIFVNWKIIIFRTISKLIEYKNPTKAQKNKSDISKPFNTYGSIYDAIRSQYYTIDSQEGKIADYKILQNDIIKLIIDIKSDISSLSLRKTLDAIIEEIQSAESLPIVAAKLYNFLKLKFVHSEIDKNLLIWAKNKFDTRISTLRSQISEMQKQLDAIENNFTKQEYIFDSLHRWVLPYIDYTWKNNSKILFAFQQYFSNIAGVSLQDPFYTFNSQIETVLWSYDKIKDSEIIKILLKAQVLFYHQTTLLEFHKLEHDIKLWKILFKDIDFKQRFFFLYSMKTNTDLHNIYTENFQYFEDKLNQFQSESVKLSTDKKYLDKFFNEILNKDYLIDHFSI